MNDGEPTDIQDPTIITIPRSSKALPDAGQLKVGDSLAMTAKITAIDDNGVSVEVESVEMAEPAPAEEPAGDEIPPEPAGNPQADYVMGKRKQVMSGTE
jgi:hypothetical protein